MRPVTLSYILFFLLASCGGNENPSSSTPASASSATESAAPAPATAGSEKSDETAAAGDPVNGEALFKQPMIAGLPGCVTCHSLQPGTRLVGPSMANAATVAASAVEGMSAEAYLREAIVEPNARVTEGFPPGLMFQDYGEKLSAQQLDDLVAFLMTQE